MSTKFFAAMAIVMAAGSGCAAGQSQVKTEDGWTVTDPAPGDGSIDSLEVVMTPPADASASSHAPAPQPAAPKNQR